VFKDS